MKTRTTVILLLLASGAAFADTEENLSKTFPAAAGDALVVDVDFGAIDVSTNTTSTQVAVDVWRKVTRKSEAEELSFLRENPVQFIPEDHTLTIRCRSPQEHRSFSSGHNRNEAKYTIRVPARFNVKLNTAGGGIGVRDVTGDCGVHTSGGALRLERLRGPLDGRTSGGGIWIADCVGAISIHTGGGAIDVAGGGGSLEGRTSGGGVTVKAFDGPVSVETSGGGITIEKANGKVRASTSGGPIHAVLTSPLPGDVTLSTSGGGVTVKVPGAAAFNVYAETSSGGVRCDLPVTVQGKIGKGHLKGVVNGGGPEVQLHSSGGGIRIEKL
jgi:DUF4097 and DUF4098 domain-containing protein YvlB